MPELGQAHHDDEGNLRMPASINITYIKPSSCKSGQTMGYQPKGSPRGDGTMFPPSGSAVPKVEEIEGYQNLGLARPAHGEQDDIENVTGPASSNSPREEDDTEKVNASHNIPPFRRG